MEIKQTEKEANQYGKKAKLSLSARSTEMAGYENHSSRNCVLWPVHQNARMLKAANVETWEEYRRLLQLICESR